MTFVQHKSSMVQRLEAMLRVFKENNARAIDQQKCLSREAAKNRAFDTILNSKMLTNKIIVQTLGEANGAPKNAERFTYDADQFERALEEKFRAEEFQKNREILRL